MMLFDDEEVTDETKPREFSAIERGSIVRTRTDLVSVSSFPHQNSLVMSSPSLNECLVSSSREFSVSFDLPPPSPRRSRKPSDESEKDLDPRNLELPSDPRSFGSRFVELFPSFTRISLLADSSSLLTAQQPTDKRVPLIAIPTEQAPPDFLERSEAYSNTLFCACIKRWPITSLHPFGTLVEEIGSIGQVEVETSALLKDCK